ncbi:MAG: type I-MYXAN CRISPR-associated protein Cas5/Cmx5/DevS [Candidatus Hydrogenedentes bacterium]|nr:type I-MYXAN CRISPR-associated protein Cas5/Cmx5/DevS [Candidatus Hydrogenedentota bacterium]
MNAVSLSVSVPVCAFRRPYAREFLETERVPPPATVYGFLLSLVGEEDRWKYTGTRLAIAMLSLPALSTVLRTVWRVKSNKSGLGIGKNKTPDYQELLIGLELAVWVAPGDVAERLADGLANPATITRYGGLSLGESRDLVDEVRLNPHYGGRRGVWLSRDPGGSLPLPVWVDHVGSKGTRWEQFGLRDALLEPPPENDDRWITILPPANTDDE